jgi:hypothetical protein
MEKLTLEVKNERSKIVDPYRCMSRSQKEAESLSGRGE